MLKKVEFGKFIRRKRKEAGFDTFAALARVSGVSASTIYRIEESKVTPTLDTLKRLAGPLGVPYPELLIHAGFLSDGQLNTELEAYAEAVIDFTDHPLTVEEKAQVEAFKQFLLAKRKR